MGAETEYPDLPTAEELAKSEYGKVPTYDDNFKGPINERGCTDVFFCILFLVFLVGLAIVTFVGFSKGEPERLLYGEDSFGNICGQTNVALGSLGTDMTDKPYLYFANIFDPLETEICVSECPATTAEDFTSPFPTFTSDEIICQFGVEYVGNTSFVKSPFNLNCKIDSLANEYLGTGTCDCFAKYASTPILNRCVPTELTGTIANYTSSAVEAVNAGDLMSKMMSDVDETKGSIFLLCVLALVLSFVWLGLLYYCAGCMVWTTVLLIVIVAIAITGLLGINTLERKEKRDDEIDVYGTALRSTELNYKTFLAFTVIAVVGTIVLLLVLLFMRKRIKLAVQIIKEAARAVSKMPLIIFYPILTFSLVAGFYLYWIFAWVFLATAGEATFTEPLANYSGSASARFDGYQPSDTVRAMQFYHIFGMFWCTGFILAMGEMVVAGAIASWYFSEPPEKKPPSRPVLKSLKRTCRYHLGSLAFGSLIIAIVQMIRFMLKYAEKQLKGKQNQCLVYVLKVLQCYFKCAERFLKFISRNAYIQVAIHGKSFCKSARNAFGLLLRNAFRLVAINFVGDFLLFLGKMTIALITGGVAIFFLKSRDDVNYYAFPALIVAVMAYGIAAGFMAVFEMAIDTIFLAFCEDCERNGSEDEGAYWMSEDLRKFVGKNSAPPPTSDLAKRKKGKDKAPTSSSTSDDQSGWFRPPFPLLLRKE